MYLLYVMDSEFMWAPKEHIWKECWYCEGAGTLPVHIERMDDE